MDFFFAFALFVFFVGDCADGKLFSDDGNFAAGLEVYLNEETVFKHNTPADSVIVLMDGRGRYFTTFL